MIIQPLGQLVAENTRTPIEVLSRLCEDTDPNVRLAIAESVYMPTQLLIKLAEDSNPYVACRAK